MCAQILQLVSIGSPCDAASDNIIKSYKVKRSGALQVLSMATDWSIPLVAKAYQPSFAWCQ